MKLIKSWVPWRTLICVGLMWATGIPQGIIKVTIKAEQQKSYSEYFNGTFARLTEKDFAALEITPENFLQYADSLKKDRELLAQHNQYTQFLYFRDLVQFKMFEIKFRDSLDYIPQKGSILINLGGFGIVGKLQGICMQQKDYMLRDSTIAKAREYWLHDTPSLETNVDWVTDVLAPLLHWFLGFYTKGFPFALILFLIWKFKLKEDFDEEFRWEKERPHVYFGTAPISFFISLLFWPFILGIDIRNRFKEALRRADVISRRVSMFTLFSKQEEKLLEFGMRMSRKEFLAYLDSIGMTQKHSFASAVCVTLFLLIIPTSLFPQKTNTVCHKEKVIIMKSDYGGGSVQYDAVAKILAVLKYDGDTEWPDEIIERTFFMTEWLYEFLYIPDIGKIPWCQLVR